MLGRSQAEFAGEEIVDLEADAIEGCFPPDITGHDEGQVADEVRRILGEQSTFPQSFQDQADVALLEVANTAMNQLGAATGSALGKVMAFEQQGRIPAGGRVHSNAQTRGAPAYDRDIP
jgi:hypothetical protein